MLFDYPLVSFYFNVQIDGIQGVAADTAFMEVSGISVQSVAVDIRDDENKNCDLLLRRQPKYSNLILKRGLVDKVSPLTNWCFETISAGTPENVTTKNILVSLLNENGDIRIGWYFVNACPIKWAISDLNSMENSIVIETLEFRYDYFKIVNP